MIARSADGNIYAQTAKASTCQFRSAGSDSSVTVTDQPLVPTGLDAVTMMPGSFGTSA